MHVITRKRITEFADFHPDSRVPLMAWYSIVDRSDFKTFAALKRTFASADWVDGMVVFNIGGNKYRLVAAIHFNRGKVYVRDILTHADYDKGRWKK